MSQRNPVTGRRRPCVPGDRLRYILPDGPPLAAIEAYGHDVQSAISAGLTLLALSLGSGLNVGLPKPNERSSSASQDVSAIATQEFL